MFDLIFSMSSTGSLVIEAPANSAHELGFDTEPIDFQEMPKPDETQIMTSLDWELHAARKLANAAKENGDIEGVIMEQSLLENRSLAVVRAEIVNLLNKLINELDCEKT